ncbi:MAG TPA: prepilin-type N-terminal cleavage/methylation domain-containing protein [Gammaproteobacteria bacterium]|nr:prepilin-type N-terminal cleavage/methylation domain-containing protein [Gammaproteobacteria bacterium]
MNIAKILGKPASLQKGMTLPEIMIALTISTILLTGVIQIFISSKQSYRLLDANSRVQENGRFSVDYLTSDLRMAGYTGCYRGTAAGVENILNTPNQFEWDLATPLAGNEWNGAGWTPALAPAIAGQVLDNTDVIITRGLDTDGIGLVAPYSDAAQLFVDSAAENINDGDIVMVTDCENASMFQVTNQQVAGGGAIVNIVHSNAAMIPGNTGSLLANSYGADAQLARFVTNVYYIGTGASGEPALFRQTLVGNTLQTQEMVDGVENMQILYGEDLDGDGVANRYVTADNANMANVSSVRVSLLLRSMDNVTDSPQSYTYNGVDTVAGDRRIRRVFTTTVKMRNRGLL